MIKFNEQTKVFHIQTKHMSYLFGVGSGVLKNFYWGSRIDEKEEDFLLDGFHSSFDVDTNLEREEYPCWNGHSYIEPCLAIQREDKRALFFEFHSWKKEKESDGAETLSLILQDKNMQVTLTLRYCVYEEYDIIARNAVVTNQGKTVQIHNIQSASVSLPQTGDRYQVRYLTGKWADEWKINQKSVETGVLTLQSKRGITGPHFNPAIAIGRENSCEEYGKVWFGALAYSGNWKISIEKTCFENVHITAGIQDFDFMYTLQQGENFTTPLFYFGFTDQGYGKMSRLLHTFESRCILPANKMRRILYNSWEATAFAVQVEEQKKLAAKAAGMGIELFVVDDGWFGERNSDHAGLGDWYVNQKKFPQGLNELIDYVNQKGMDFGIWVEPEAVNPDSELYKKHPDWIYRYSEPEPMQSRNQYVLNITLPEVKEYLKHVLYELLSSHHITFLKWDMNRAISDMAASSGKNNQELCYLHVQALYELWAYIRNEFPWVELETCAGGGGRVDLGILSFADQCWPSDNTDAFDRLLIQEGYTQFYPPRTMMCWVTDVSGESGRAVRSIKYRFHCAMCGGLGIGANINHLSELEQKEFAQYIAQYKELRHIIQYGSLYRLISPSKYNLNAVQYLSEDEKEIAVVVFLHNMHYGEFLPRVRLQGLNPDANYEITSQGKQYSGSYLMEVGIQTNLKGDFDSALFYIKKSLIKGE